MTDPNTVPLEWFANIMLKNLSRPSNVDKPHWSNLSESDLLKRIKDEVDELSEALCGGGTVMACIHECADIANFCAVLADNLNQRPPEPR